jgi:three-Cys-motif partner protein
LETLNAMTDVPAFEDDIDEPDAARPGERLNAQAAGHWAREKLFLLENYLPAFVRACKGAEGGCFIDAFSGPGRNRDETGEFDGSPCIAARYGFRNIVLIDNNPENTAALERLALGSNVTIRTGDANSEVLAALQQLPRWLPVLVFLDQFSTQVDFETLQEIAAWSQERNRKPELLILHPTGMALQRFFPEGRAAIHPHVLDRVFGSREAWAQIEQDRMRGQLPGSRLIAALTERYCRLLADEFGYLEEPVYRHIRKDGESGIFLYSLVFATDHPKGKKIMESCFAKRFSGQMTIC